MRKWKIKKHFTILKEGLKEVNKLQAFILPVTILNALFKASAPFVNIYMSARIIDELLGHKNINYLEKLVLLTVFLNLGIYLISSILEHFKIMLKNNMYYNQSLRLNEKIINMDYENVENPEIHALRTKISEAYNMMGGGIYSLIDYIGDFIKGLITVIVSIVLVINLFKETSGGNAGFNSRLFSYVFLALLLFGTMLTLRLKTKADIGFFKYFNKVMDINRIFSFYSKYSVDYSAGKEIRLCDQKDIVNEEIKSFGKKSSKMFKAIGKMNGKYGALEAFIISFLSGTIYIFVGLKALYGAITIGSIVQYAGSISQFMTGNKEFLSSFNSILNNNQYIEQYIDFLNIKDEKRKGTLPVEKRNDDEYEIEFKNVSFKYPETEDYALKNVSLKLNIGERLAIVGMNGSGKTTFIKLLCRLYDPTEGEILLNGINIKKYNYTEYISLFSIVFQDFKLFSFSLGQNVAADVNYHEEAVTDILDEVGFDKRLEHMKDGVKTSLYKDFDESGVEISGGEAQKIALARALYKNAPIIILDEPTAALDPVSEFEIYKRFNEIVGTKTAFYISHRLSSCRFCNEIAVFNKGSLVQKGTHHKLLEDVKGKYYELWNSQAKYYNESISSGL